MNRKFVDLRILVAPCSRTSFCSFYLVFIWILQNCFDIGLDRDYYCKIKRELSHIIWIADAALYPIAWHRLLFFLCAACFLQDCLVGGFLKEIDKDVFLLLENWHGYFLFSVWYMSHNAVIMYVIILIWHEFSTKAVHIICFTINVERGRGRWAWACMKRPVM